MPENWKRYFLDSNRFSAQFPEKPKATDIQSSIDYEAHNKTGSIFVVICHAPPADPNWMKGMHATVASSGKIIAEKNSDFFGTTALDTRVRLPDKTERFMLFVQYKGRYCTAGAELVQDAEETQAARFIQSFRPEPTP
ncbi:MAG: hypothetical protein ACRELB_15200 [Polyangiaceae bacterium]